MDEIRFNDVIDIQKNGKNAIRNLAKTRQVGFHTIIAKKIQEKSDDCRRPEGRPAAASITVPRYDNLPRWCLGEP